MASVVILRVHTPYPVEIAVDKKGNQPAVFTPDVIVSTQRGGPGSRLRAVWRRYEPRRIESGTCRIGGV